MDPLKICLLSSEVTPFAKTGGLADVSAALAGALKSRGHEVLLFMPLYERVEKGDWKFDFVPELKGTKVSFGEREIEFEVFTTSLPNSKQLVHLIHCPELYGRKEIYTSDKDEHLRFAMLSRAALDCCQRLGFAPDVIHCNDWHTGLLPLYLKTIYAWDKLFEKTKTVMTIHNIGYQGMFPADVIPELGLLDGAKYFDQADRDDGLVNFLRTGLTFADKLTTVSATYAHEIQTPELGMGLEGLLQSRAADLSGIVNGVDYADWSPEQDKLIPHAFSAKDIGGKALNKRALLDYLRLPHDANVPVLGVVSRMTAQKGFDVMFDVLPRRLEEHDMRLTVLGSGEKKYEDFFRWLKREFPTKVGFETEFNDGLAHLIEAGADIFLMPSRYEPCGLNQMYSLKYGTIPIVRKTGGLADTVEQFDPATRKGTGFVFEHFMPSAFQWAFDFALETYADSDAWKQLMQNAMACDTSWDKQVLEYEKLYRNL